ncbi:MAG: hypothetical protein EWV79_15345 [Microcystis aeruginosa Ma_MB_S_20031200_S102D]|nr:MAG: hypothetical protein EWV79_15345 [Microcystis aeruginosa Ma_MB_S_20031200_S102D]
MSTSADWKVSTWFFSKLFSLTANLSDKINDDTVVIILLRRIHVCSGKFSTLKGLSNKELAVPEE